MAISHFKDIYSYLSYLYPNRKVYVCSDHHFYHSKMLEYTRKEFSTVQEMDEYIIKIHNETVSPDDIVIFLGDFCFKNSEITNINRRLNGHKFLIIGNHDNYKTYLKKYSSFEFEDIFLYPVKFDNAYLSHYPLLGEKPENVLYDILAKEFKDSKGFNIYGHEHDNSIGYSNSINVTLESQGYKPLCIGKTGHDKNYAKMPFIICYSNKIDILDQLSHNCNISTSLLLNDYIYTMMIESTSAFANEIFFCGSFSLYKKYGFAGPFSDLDASIIYNGNISKKANNNVLKKCVDSSFMALKDIEGFNLSFYKRMQSISIIESYFSCKGIICSHNYLDVNLSPINIYLPTDFITISGTSTLEKLCNKYYPELVNDYYFPNYTAKFLNGIGDIANIILQYFYKIDTTDNKKLLLKKLSLVLHNLTEEEKKNYSYIENTLIRFLIRNIQFFMTTNRQNEIELIKNIKPNISELNSSIPNSFIELLDYIFYSANSYYNQTINIISNLPISQLNEATSEFLTETKKILKK